MKESFRSIIIKGTFILTISNFLVSGLNYVSNSLTAKSLGPSGFGELSTLFAYISIFYVPLTVLTTLIIVKLGRSKEKSFYVAQQIEQWFRSKLYEQRFLISLLLTSVIFVPYLTNLSSLSSLVLYILIGLGVINTFYFSILQGLHLFTKFSSLVVLISISRLVGTLAAYFNIGGIHSIYLGLVSGGVLSVILARKSIPRSVAKNTEVLSVKLRDYFTRKQTLITSASLLSVAVLMNIDLMLVKRIFTSEIAGIYSSWSLLSKIIGYFTAPMLSVSLLFFSAKESGKDNKKILYFLISTVIIIGSGILLLYEKFTTDVLLLIFSSKFLEIAPLAPYAALFGMLVTIIALINNYYISSNSRSALITPIIIPMHIILLIIYGTSLESIIAVNVGSAFFITGILTISLLHSS